MQTTTPRTTRPKLPPVRVIRTVDRIRDGFSKLNKKLVPPPVALLEMISSQWVSQALSVAAELGVADQIPVEGSESSDRIAQLVGAQPEALYRLMRALATVGVFDEKPSRRFRLTAMGRCLRSDHPQSMRHMSIFQGQMNWANWGQLIHSVRTGECAAYKVLGKKPFDWLAENPKEADTFDRAMTNISSMETETVLAVYDFAPYRTIADVGGGHGKLLGSVLALYPSARGILFDMPHVVAGASENLSKLGVHDRVERLGGSFFESAPAGADLYMLKHIIHDWSDEESIRILKHVREKIPPHGKLVLLEAVVPGPGVPHFSKFLDLEMLVVTTGHERTEEQFRELLLKAGFRLERIVPTISMTCVVEAVPN